MARRPSAAVSPGLSLDDVTYDPITHTSTLRDGRNVPHVTSVLQAVGASTDFAELAGISTYIGESIELARQRGRAVHADCHAYDDNDLHFSTVHPAVLPYLEAWITFRAEMNIDPLERERRLFDPTYLYTGIMDGIFFRKNVGHILIDIKTGDPDDSACNLQTAAYEQAWHAMRKNTRVGTAASVRPLARWAVQLTPKNKIPYRIRDYSSAANAHADHGEWLACLCVYNIQRRRTARP